MSVLKNILIQLGFQSNGECEVDGIDKVGEESGLVSMKKSVKKHLKEADEKRNK